MAPRKKTPAQLDREIAAALRAGPSPRTAASRPAMKLELATTTEYGVKFKTGVPVTFATLRNTEKSPFVGATYGQDIEPHGRYLLHHDDPTREPPSSWQRGTVTFQCPLVIPLAGDEGAIYGPTGWKARLVAATGKKGAALSRYLAKTYDGIVTVDSAGDTREIVDLSRFK